MKLYVILCGLVLAQALPFKDINDGATITASLNELDSYSIPTRNTQQLKPPVQEQDDEWTIISRMRDMQIPPTPDAKDYYSLHDNSRASNRFARTRRSLKFDGDSKSVDPGLQAPPRTETQGRQTGLSFEGSSSSDGKDGDKKFLPGLFGVQGPGYYPGGGYGGGYPGGGYPVGGGYQPIYGQGAYQPIYGQGYYGHHPGAGYPVGGQHGGYYPNPGGGYPGLGGNGGATSSASASAGGGGGGYRPPYNALHGNGYYGGGYGNGYGNGYYPNGGVAPILGGGIGPGGFGGPQFGVIGGGFFKDGKDGGSVSASSNPSGGVKGSVTFEK